ncbi:MAG TPA: asparagine synthase-related protein [Thermodesulfobacteriota bacterium]
MPGIAGIIDLSSGIREELKAEAVKMAGLLCAPRDSTAAALSFEGGAFASVSTPAAPMRMLADDGAAAVAFWGHLWDLDELRRSSGLELKSISDVSSAKLLLEIYRKNGIAGLCGLNGRFVIALWEKGSGRLHLICDRYGFTKLYYRHGEGQVRFASEYKAIIRSGGFSGRIDEEAIADFAAFGYPTEDRTFFDEIRLIPQASVVTFEQGKAPSVRRYWDYAFYSEGDPIWDEEDYVDEFYMRLKTAVQRQLVDPGRAAVPLSGGYDSRTLAGILERLGLGERVDTFSFGNERSFDVLYGGEIARRLGFRHSFIPITGSVMKDRAESFVWQLEGTVNCISAHMLLTRPVIEEKGSKSIVTGFFGDVTCGTDMFYMGLRGSANDDEIVRKQFFAHANIMQGDELKGYMKARVFEKAGGRAFEVFRKRYFSCPAASRYYKSRYFNLHERQRRYASFNLFVFDSAGRVVSPFLDRDFVEFACRMPPHLAIHSNLYRKMIIKHLPKAAAARHNDTRLPINASDFRKGLHWRWERLLKNPVIRATVGRRYARMNDNYMDIDNALRNGSKEFVLSRIRGNDFLAQYFDMDRVGRLLDAHMSGERNEYGKITALLTLSLWHGLFIEGKGYERSAELS